MDVKQHADILLEEFELCMRARPKHDAVNLQLEKDAVAVWANHLQIQRSWGSNSEIAEACNQLQYRLATLKEHLIIEILTHGTV